jgi:bifunctional isochorismate lyase/aryl carrier protein
MNPPMTLDRLRSDVAAVLDEPVSGINDDDNLVDLGLDSIRIMTLVELWRGSGLTASYLDLAEQPTLVAWWALLCEQDAGPAT